MCVCIGIHTYIYIYIHIYIYIYIYILYTVQYAIKFSKFGQILYAEKYSVHSLEHQVRCVPLCAPGAAPLCAPSLHTLVNTLVPSITCEYMCWAQGVHKLYPCTHTCADPCAHHGAQRPCAHHASCPCAERMVFHTEGVHKVCTRRPFRNNQL